MGEANPLASVSAKHWRTRIRERLALDDSDAVSGVGAQHRQGIEPLIEPLAEGHRIIRVSANYGVAIAQRHHSFCFPSTSSLHRGVNPAAPCVGLPSAPPTPRRSPSQYPATPRRCRSL